MSTTQETKNQDERSFCNNCRKVTSWRRTRKRSRCLSCNTIFPCAHACEHWDCREERGEAKPDANGILRLVTPTLLILALSLASLAPLACGGDDPRDQSQDASPSLSPSPLPALTDAASPSPTPRPMGPPSPQTPGADAGAVDGGVTGNVSADARSGDAGSSSGDTGDAGSKDGGTPPILQPKLDAGGSCQQGSWCPLAVDEGSGIYSLKSGTTKPPSSCILGTGSLYEIGVYWFQDYQGKRYVFRIVGSCAITGDAQPYVIFPYVKIEDVNPECGKLTDQIQLTGEWKSFVGPHTFVETGALDGVSCANKRGRCARYQCYDSSGKVIK